MGIEGPALMPTNTIVTGPVAGGWRGWPFSLPLTDLASVGYVAEEFFLDGTAAAYEAEPGAKLTVDGLVVRRFVVLFIAVLAFVLAAPPDNFPAQIDLPDGFFPEGIESGRGTTVFVGSLVDGAIWRGDVRTGSGAVLADGAAGEVCLGRHRLRGRSEPTVGCGWRTRILRLG
jgi:hypothetical protein